MIKWLVCKVCCHLKSLLKYESIHVLGFCRGWCHIAASKQNLEHKYQLVAASMPAQLEQFRESALSKDTVTQRTQWKGFKLANF